MRLAWIVAPLWRDCGDARNGVAAHPVSRGGIDRRFDRGHVHGLPHSRDSVSPDAGYGEIMSNECPYCRKAWDDHHRVGKQEDDLLTCGIGGPPLGPGEPQWRNNDEDEGKEDTGENSPVA